MEDLNWAIKELRKEILSIKHNNLIIISYDLEIEKNSENFYDFIHFSPKGSLEFSYFISSKLESLISSKKICKK